MIDWANLPVENWTGTLGDLVRLYLGIEAGVPEVDEAIARACNVAGTAVESWLDRTVAKREVLENFPHHFGTVDLSQYPVDSLANWTVYLNGAVADGFDLFLRTGGHAAITRIGHAHDAPMDWRKFDQVGVTYTAGYAKLPADLAEAICWAAADVYRSEGTGKPPAGGDGDVKSINVFDVGSISYQTGGSAAAIGLIPATAVETLSRYRRIEA